MKKEKIAVLASGGLDSNILLGHLLKRLAEVYPLYIRAGFIWEKAELFWLKKFLKQLRNKRLRPLTVLNLPIHDVDPNSWALTGRKTPGYRSGDEEVYLPGRNLLLLSKAATFCAMKRISTIAIGSLSGNPFPDARPEFFESFGKTASLALNQKIRVIAPFLGFKKSALLNRAKGLPLHLSFSCLKPRGLKPCHGCNKCAERDRTFLI